MVVHLRSYVWKEFYLDPKPEKAKFFGDLCFLTQMREEWDVDDAVELEVFSSGFGQNADGLETVAKILRCCVGLESFVSHSCKELLLTGAEDPQAVSWRRLLKLLEG